MTSFLTPLYVLVNSDYPSLIHGEHFPFYNLICQYYFTFLNNTADCNPYGDAFGVCDVQALSNIQIITTK